MESDKPPVVSVLGLGYIGLPTAAVIASRGIKVLGVDIRKETVDTINQGEIHIVEPDLDMVVRAAVTTGTLRASATVEPADVFIVAVPTPVLENNEPDVSHVVSVIESIASVLEKGNLIIIESTCPPGTTEMLANKLSTLCPTLTFPHLVGDSADVSIAYCPERVLPGMVLQELVNNDRVIGGITRTCTQNAVELYKFFVRGNCIETTARTAEVCKLTENAYRDVNIAFANELSLVSDLVDVDVWELIGLANLHPRVNILNPGPGVGGHCIAVDPWFLVSAAPLATPLIQAARAVNDGMPGYVFEKVIQKADRFKNPQVACFGLSFKANIDDVRESPALGIVEKLVADSSCELLIVEPYLTDLPVSLKVRGNVQMCTVAEALQRADIILGLVDHKEFCEIPLEKLKEKVVIDTRGMWSYS